MKLLPVGVDAIFQKCLPLNHFIISADSWAIILCFIHLKFALEYETINIFWFNTAFNADVGR